MRSFSGSLCVTFGFVASLSLLLTGPVSAQSSPKPPTPRHSPSSKPQVPLPSSPSTKPPIPLPSGPGSKPPVPLPSGPGTKPPIPLPGQMNPLPPQPKPSEPGKYPVRPGKPHGHRPHNGCPPSCLLCYPPQHSSPRPYIGSAPYPISGLNAAIGVFQTSSTFRFRWNEQREPRASAEYRSLTCAGEAQRIGGSLRLRFKVTMVTAVDTQYSEWIVMSAADGGQRFHRQTTDGPWNEITNATPWLTEMTQSLLLYAYWQAKDDDPSYTSSLSNSDGNWSVYGFTANAEGDIYRCFIHDGTGRLHQVTHRSRTDSGYWGYDTFYRTIDYWGYDLFTEIAAPLPGDTSPLPVPAKYAIADRR